VNDEPLEDLIEAHATTYTKAVTDSEGVYRIATVATGTPAPEYFAVVVPDVAVDAHLPGGTFCREPKAATDLIGKQLDMQVSSKPGPKAFYVGASACYTCHGRQHEKYTLHLNGLRPTGKPGPLQKADKYFPRWNEANAKFTAGDVNSGGTILYYWPSSAANTDWKLSETAPASGVVLTARLYTEGGKYWVQFKDALTVPTVATYEVEFSYGGGLYKQRWFTPIANANGTKSRYILPIQYNFDSAPAGGNAINEATDPYTRWMW